VNRLRRWLAGLLLALPLAAFAQPAHPTLYNNLDGDRDVELDRLIKQAYGPRFTIIDTGAAQGFAGPVATQGEMPANARDSSGRSLGGYVMVIYVINAEGRVAEPVVVRNSDPRLDQAALGAMAQWRFTPATVGGTPVASTAAQEFNFGPVDVSFGYQLQRVVTYQSTDILIHRTPPKPEMQAYLKNLSDSIHRFIVGETRPENLDVVLILRPGRRVRCWIVSSRRPGGGPELAPLRTLLEAVPAAEVKDGPVAIALQGIVAGGATPQPESYRPIPQEWQERERGLKEALPYASDAFMALVFP
jgi:TonB family protein